MSLGTCPAQAFNTRPSSAKDAKREHVPASIFVAADHLTQLLVKNGYVRRHKGADTDDERFAKALFEFHSTIFYSYEVRTTHGVRCTAPPPRTPQLVALGHSSRLSPAPRPAVAIHPECSAPRPSCPCLRPVLSVSFPLVARALALNYSVSILPRSSTPPPVLLPRRCNGPRCRSCRRGPRRTPTSCGSAPSPTTPC